MQLCLEAGGVLRGFRAIAARDRRRERGENESEPLRTLHSARET
jgi:hypothetical protein